MVHFLKSQSEKYKNNFYYKMLIILLKKHRFQNVQDINYAIRRFGKTIPHLLFDDIYKIDESLRNEYIEMIFPKYIFDVCQAIKKIYHGSDKKILEEKINFILDEKNACGIKTAMQNYVFYDTLWRMTHIFLTYNQMNDEEILNIFYE